MRWLEWLRRWLGLPPAEDCMGAPLLVPHRPCSRGCGLVGGCGSLDCR